MARTFRLAPFLLGAFLWLGACAGEPLPPTYRPLSFEGLPPYRLDVQEIDIVHRYRSPLRSPNVEHLFPTPPADAVERWAQARLEAAGDFGVAKVVIEEASAVLKPLAVSGGIAGMFRREQAEELSGRLRVRIEVIADGPVASGYAEADAQGRRTVPEGVSDAERDRIYHEFGRELVERFDVAMNQAIRQHLRPLLR